MVTEPRSPYLSYQAGKGVWVSASATEFHLRERSHRGACAYKAHCRKTSYPRNYTPANMQKKTQPHIYPGDVLKGPAPATLLSQPDCVCAGSQTPYTPIAVTLLGAAAALLTKPSPFSTTQLQPTPTRRR